MKVGEQVLRMSLNASSCMLPLPCPCLLIVLVTPARRSALMIADAEHTMAATVSRFQAAPKSLLSAQLRATSRASRLWQSAIDAWTAAMAKKHAGFDLVASLSAEPAMLL